ncbi:hypothetical protein RJ55_04081 [Drechmeria coniospora]|nr:hypothetical protein RJ55_04081 [Drechmeria coniospora]
MYHTPSKPPPTPHHGLLLLRLFEIINSLENLAVIPRGKLPHSFDNVNAFAYQELLTLSPAHTRPARKLIYPLTHPPTHSPAPSLTYSLIYSLSFQSPIESLTTRLLLTYYSKIYSLTHPCSHDRAHAPLFRLRQPTNQNRTHLPTYMSYAMINNTSESSSAALVQATSSVEGVRVITLSRPEKRNALSKELIVAFLVELARASADPNVKAVIITGQGSFFSAGADLNDIAALDSAGARSARYLEDLCSGMAAVRKPILAAVNGPALGGGFELALMVRQGCDLIIAAKSAYFALPETKRGLIPGAGGTQRLTATVGKYLAMRTILLARPITGPEALSCGLLCDLVDDDNLLTHATAVAAGLSGHGPEALAFAKEAICRADALGRDDLFERNLYYATFSTDEKRQGVDEFLASRRSGK